MKALITNYTFQPSTRQIFLSGVPSVALNQLLLITNVSKNSILYNFTDSAFGGNVTNNVITLSANTSSMSASDSLQIFLDDLLTPSSENTLSAIRVNIDTLTTTVSSGISAVRTTPTFADFDSNTQFGGHYPIGGRYVDATIFAPISASSQAADLTGFDAAFNIDVGTGGAMMLQGDLDKDIDSVTSYDVGYASVSNYLSGSTLGTVASGTGTQVLFANSNRITFFGQNFGTSPLLVKYGLGCNNSSFNFMLYPGTAAFDGRGEKFSDDRYKGDVSVNTTTGLSAFYTFWEGV